MANGPAPSLRSDFDVQARPNQPEVIDLLDDEEQDQQAAARSSRPSFAFRRRRVSVPEDDDEVIILDGPPPPKRKGVITSTFVDDPPQARRSFHLPRQPRSSPRLPTRPKSVPGHVDAVILHPGDTPDLALSVDGVPRAQTKSSAHLRNAIEPRVVIDLMDIDSDIDEAPPRRDGVASSSSSSVFKPARTQQSRPRQQHPHNALAGPSRLPLPPLNHLPQPNPRSHGRIGPSLDPAQALKLLQTDLILTLFPSFPTSLIPEVLDLSWSFHPSSHPFGASLPLDALTPVAQRSITRSVLRSFVRHEMTRYEAELVEMMREVKRRWGESDESRGEAELWKRGKYARVRKEANRVADELLIEFEGRPGGGDDGRARERTEHEDEEDDDAWDRDEWRD